MLVLGGLGWYVVTNLPTTTCPKPKTIQYSYDDSRDYLGPFLTALTSHDSRTVRRYYVPGITATDKQTLEQALKDYRAVPLTVDGESTGFPWSDISDAATNGGKVTRLTWTTKKVDGCWRMQRVDTKVLTVGVAN